MRTEVAQLLSHEALTADVRLMALRCPNIAQAVKPGHFIHLLVPQNPQLVLRRPFSVYDVSPDSQALYVLYRVVGEGTAALAQLRAEAGIELSCMGPLGTGWTPPAGIQRALLLGGGIGAAPLFLLARELLQAGVSVTFLQAAQTAEQLVCAARTRELASAAFGAGALSLRCITDDGSNGVRGYAQDLLNCVLDEATEGAGFQYAAVCGPGIVMKLAAERLQDAGVPTQVSLERRMACGIGACLSCVVSTVNGKRKACSDGPVFNAQEVIW